MTPVRGACHAWLQADGGWGLSNAGLVLGRGESLLIDTLFDQAHTQRMLDGLGDLTRKSPIQNVVNTHGNGDHWFGNMLLPEANVIAAEASVADMRAVGPETVQALVTSPGPTGDYARRIFKAFDFANIVPRYPDETFDRETVFDVAGVELLLLNLGPAHTSGDTVVFCEQDAVVFTGDLMFAGGTPIVWEGPVQNWIEACHRIQELGADTVVPGHGPISPIGRVQEMTDYLEFVRDESAMRLHRGMPAQEAARDIDLGRFQSWPEAERLAANVAAIYNELSPGSTVATTGPELFGCMAELSSLRHPTTPGGG